MVPGSMPMRGPGGARGGMRGPMGRGDYGESLICLALITHYIITNATVTRATGLLSLTRASRLFTKVQHLMYKSSNYSEIG